MKGMLHEEILAIAIYFIHRHENIEGGHILIKRVFREDEADWIYSNVGKFQGDTQRVFKLVSSRLVELKHFQIVSWYFQTATFTR